MRALLLAALLALPAGAAPSAPSAEPRLVDPFDGLASEWVVASGRGKGCRLAVDPGGQPWLGCRGRFLAAPDYAMLFETERPFESVAWLDDGELAAASGDSAGGYALAEVAKHTSSLARAKFHTLKRSQGAAARVFPGAGNAAYAVFERDGTSEIALLTADADGWTARALIAMKGRVGAVAGDGERTFVAYGRKIAGFARLPDGSLEPQPLWEHPDEPVTGLAWKPRAGLIYATKSGVGFLGSRFRFQFLRARDPQIALSARALFVLPAGGGVLKIGGIESLALQDGALAQAGAPVAFGPDAAPAQGR